MISQYQFNAIVDKSLEKFPDVRIVSSASHPHLESYPYLVEIAFGSVRSRIERNGISIGSWLRDRTQSIDLLNASFNIRDNLTNLFFEDSIKALHGKS